MWPILLLALPVLAQAQLSVTVRTLIPPVESVGSAKFLAGHIENVYGFVQYCNKCDGISPIHIPWMLLTSLTHSSMVYKLNIAAEKKAAAVIFIGDNLVETALESSYSTVKSSFERKYGPGTMDMPVILMTKESGEKLLAFSQKKSPVILEPEQPNSFTKGSLLAVMVVIIAVALIMGICAIFMKKDSVPTLPPKRPNCPYQVAVSKIPTQELTDAQDPVCDEETKCAVCLEGFQIREVVSHLPCKHIFHKECIDPWLLEKRVCPMCKMDVVKFYGPVNMGSEESIVDMSLDDDLSVNTMEDNEELID